MSLGFTQFPFRAGIFSPSLRPKRLLQSSNAKLNPVRSSGNSPPGGEVCPTVKLIFDFKVLLNSVSYEVVSKFSISQGWYPNSVSHNVVSKFSISQGGIQIHYLTRLVSKFSIARGGIQIQYLTRWYPNSVSHKVVSKYSGLTL
jgi:hypothetical protein